MREAIGGTWLFGLVITFIVFFASFLAISINYSKAFNVKNNVVDLITKYEGNNKQARKHIANYLRDTGYLIPGDCNSKIDDDFTYIGYNLDGTNASTNSKAYYCISEDSTDNNVQLEKKFYRVIVFFRIDLPVIGPLTTFRIKGETESIYFPVEEIN